MGIGAKAAARLNRAVFLDRDGVVNEIVDRGEDFSAKGRKVRFTAPFNYGEFKIKQGVKEALEAFKRLGLIRIIVTNQPDLTYGFLPRAEHKKIIKSVLNLPVDDVFVCPHGRDDGCQCKKPKPGMLLEAAGRWNIDLRRSYMVGDTGNDILAGKSAGCKTILIRGPHSGAGGAPDFIAGSLSEAVQIIEKLEKAS